MFILDSRRLMAKLIERRMMPLELARQIEVSPPTVARWLRKDRKIFDESMIKLCRALDCNPEDLFITDHNGGFVNG